MTSPPFRVRRHEEERTQPAMCLTCQTPFTQTLIAVMVADVMQEEWVPRQCGRCTRAKIQRDRATAPEETP